MWLAARATVVVISVGPHCRPNRVVAHELAQVFMERLYNKFEVHVHSYPRRGKLRVQTWK
jgi:hypothetical protein